MELAEADPATEVEISLPDLKVQTEGFSAEFVIDPYTRWRLEKGLDDIGLSLRHTDAISAFETTRPDYLPVTSRG